MKLATLLLTVATGLAGCAQHIQSVQQKAAPSLDNLGVHISTAQASTSRAQAHSAAIGASAQTLRSDAQRIDDKAVVVLKWLNGK